MQLALIDDVATSPKIRADAIIGVGERLRIWDLSDEWAGQTVTVLEVIESVLIRAENEHKNRRLIPKKSFLRKSSGVAKSTARTQLEIRCLEARVEVLEQWIRLALPHVSEGLAKEGRQLV